MKDILVFLSPAAQDILSPAGRYAIALARMHGAHLSALIADIEPDLSVDLLPEPDIRQVERAATEPPLSTERVARTAKLVQSAAADAGVSCDILQTESQSLSLRERIIHCAQVHDILIIDVRGPLESPC